MRIVLITILMLLLSGCGTSLLKPVVVEKRVLDIPLFHPPLPDGVNWIDFKWKVYNTELLLKELCDGNGKCVDDIIDVIVKHTKEKPKQIVIYGLTPKGYEIISGNMAELKRVLKGYKSVIVYYQTVGDKNENME